MDRDNRDKRKHNPDAEGTTPAQRITARFGLTRGRHFCALLSHTNSIPDTNQVPCSNLTSTRNRYPRGDGEVVCVFCTADMDTTSTLAVPSLTEAKDRKRQSLNSSHECATRK